MQPGASAYSTLTPLGDGRFGLLYEAADEATGRVTEIRFARIDRDWLGPGGCAGFPPTAAAPGG